MNHTYFAVVNTRVHKTVLDKLSEYKIPYVLDHRLFYEIRALIPSHLDTISTNTQVIVLCDNPNGISASGNHAMCVQVTKNTTDIRNLSATPNTVTSLSPSFDTDRLRNTLVDKNLYVYFFSQEEFIAFFEQNTEPMREFDCISTHDSLTLTNLRLCTKEEAWQDDKDNELLCGNFLELVLPGESTKDKHITVEFVFNPEGRYALTFGENVYDTVRKVDYTLFWELFHLLRGVAENQMFPLFDIYVTAVWDKKQKPKARAKTKK